MTLRERLDADMKAAMRDKDAVKLSTVRMIKSAMKYRETEPGAKGPLDEAGIVAVVGSEIKKRRDAIVEFDKAGRQELADKERAELKILEAYLPPQLTPAEIEAAVDEAISATGAKGPKDMGAVMKALLPKTQGRADGKVVSDLVKKKLSAVT
jgi:uncharacterized protein YqeY